MKKTRLVAAILCLVALLIGCAPTNVVESVALNVKEQRLVSALTDQTAVFEYRLDGEIYNWLSLWARRFEYGELTETIDLHPACEVEKGGDIVLSVFRGVEDVAPKMFNVFILQDDVVSSQFNALPDIAELGENGQAVQTALSATIPESGNVVLMVLYTSGENGIQPLSEGFIADYEGHIEEISAYETTYILGCTFASELPDGLSDS